MIIFLWFWKEGLAGGVGGGVLVAARRLHCREWYTGRGVRRHWEAFLWGWRLCGRGEVRGVLVFNYILVWEGRGVKGAIVFEDNIHGEGGGGSVVIEDINWMGVRTGVSLVTSFWRQFIHGA